MSLIYIAVGFVLLALGGGLFYVGLPSKDGQIKPKATTELYAFAVLVSLTVGGAFFLNGVLG